MIVIVVRFNRVFNEVGVTHSVERHIIFDCEVMYSMRSYGSIIGVVNCVSDYMRLVYISDHMEVDWISSKFKGLSNVLKLNVANVSDT